ncbi:MAG TPA: cytidylate kinase-like family protein [Polyangia bacterium]|nr:cytidylate kinase-like family protein [Polyangia bacterium]
MNQQILRWQEERRIAERARPGRSSDLPRPNLTVSRQFGARGAELGQRVAADLGFRFYSQELIHFIAEESHVADQVVESLDERVRAGVPRRVAQLLKGSGFTPSDYLRNLSRVVTALGRMGGGVIIGRGAHLLLEQSLTLRIRVIAPLDRRIERVAEKYHLPEPVAREKIQRIDDERVAFNRQHYGVDVGDPSHYDLVINTGLLPIETCTALVTTAFRARFADA